MATKPELKRAIANTKIKASDYNFNFDKLNDYIENGIADNAINNYEADREYPKEQWVLANTSEGKGLYESQVDGNKGNSLLDTTYWKKVIMGGVEERLENKADKTELDGKLYVVPDELISLSKATAIGVYEKDLSNILPNDGYEYEVELLLDGFWSTGNTCHAHINTSILSNETYPPMYINVNSATVRMTQRATVPIGVDRILTLTISNVAFNTLNLNIYTYRRIGNRG